MEPLASNAEKALIQLRPAWGYPSNVHFVLEAYERSSASGRHLLPFVAIDTENSTMDLQDGCAVSEPLTPGTYTLEGSMPGGRVRRQEVQLVAGEQLKVTLDFGGMERE